MFPWQRRRRQQSIQGDTCFATLICHSAATACTQLRDIVCAERRCLPMSAGRQMSTVYQMARPGLVKTKKAGSKSWGRHQACEDLGSALTSCRLGSAGGGNKPWPSSSRMGALRSAGRPSISHWRMSPHTRDPHAGTSSRPVTQMPPGAKQSLQPREACARCPSPGPLELPRVLPKRIHRPE